MKTFRFTITTLIATLALMAQPSSATETVPAYFEQAYAMIEDMLLHPEKMDFKEVVFAVDNAYLEGKADHDAYIAEIGRITEALRPMARTYAMQMPSVDLARNYAIHSCYINGNAANRGKPFAYDMQTTLRNGMPPFGTVIELLQTGLGTCRSLPFLYKILADELDAKAWLAMAPNHCFIRQRDANGTWWNFETTAGQFFHTSTYIRIFNIPEVSIRNGLYLKELTDTELLAYALQDLVNAYHAKTGIWSDDFIRRCFTLGLSYVPICNLQLDRWNYLYDQLRQRAMAVGIRTESAINAHPATHDLYVQVEALRDSIKEMGFVDITPEFYMNNLREMQQFVESQK
ncbi:MAG: hypothetical protein IJU36_03840 [Paludibacteraceae bacterium]|nr:hypothetical protein [Paludibacteraceae bacterium]